MGAKTVPLLAGAGVGGLGAGLGAFPGAAFPGAASAAALKAAAKAGEYRGCLWGCWGGPLGLGILRALEFICSAQSTHALRCLGVSLLSSLPLASIAQR